jgi:hypothetical protein
MERTLLQLVSSHRDLIAAKNATELIEEEPTLKSEVASGTVDFNRIIGVVLTKETDEDELLEENPWIEKEFVYSKNTHLRVLPIILYDSTLEDIDEIYEKHISEIYDDLFSDEFKPLAYDIAYPNVSNRELARVLRLYYSK